MKKEMVSIISQEEKNDARMMAVIFTVGYRSQIFHSDPSGMTNGKSYPIPHTMEYKYF